MSRPVHPREWSLTVGRTARYFTLGEPGRGAREVWFVCHGYGQLAAAFLGEFTSIDGDGRMIVAPEALSRFYLEGGTGAVGASWMTREERESEIDDYLAFLDATYRAIRDRSGGSLSRIVLLGFSQGTATVSRWAGRGTITPPPERVILWGGGLPPEPELAGLAPRLSRIPFTLVVGSRDRTIDPAAVVRERDRLAAAGVPCDLIRFEGGHRLDREVLEELARR